MKYITLRNTLFITLIAVTLTGNAIAGKPNAEPPTGFQEVKTKQLDQAWVNPNFKARNYKTIVIRWGDFDYKPAKKFYRYGTTINNNFEMTEWAKAQLQDNAYKEFAKHLGDLDDFDVIQIEDANHRTMGVNLTLTDIVNHVPDPMQIPGRYDFYVRNFGSVTLNIELIDLETGELLFKGNVRDRVEAHGMNFQNATPIVAAHQTRWKLKRWATGLKKGLDDMK